ncbi:hypothetical protein ACNHUS_34710 [Actinomycetes bacterium M1A6_2h]
MALDLFIVVFAWLVVLIRLLVVKNRNSQIVTLLITCFTLVATLKCGPINDFLTGIWDARSVRLMAHLLCVAAAAAAAWSAITAVGRRGNGMALLGVTVVCYALLSGLDRFAGDRRNVIELASPTASVVYFSVYAGTIAAFEVYALAVLVRAIFRTNARAALLTPAVTVVGLFLATGLNALSLLWYSIQSADGHLGAAERLQRNSNGNLFAYFALVVAVVGLSGAIMTPRNRLKSETAVDIDGLTHLWIDLTAESPKVRLAMSSLDADSQIVRMVTECIDAIYLKNLDVDSLLKMGPSTDNSNTPRTVLRRATDSDVIALASRWPRPQ